MATYAVTFTEDDWGETGDRYKTKAEADERMAAAQAAGRFARLIRWENNQSLEVRRVNAGKDRK